MTGVPAGEGRPAERTPTESAVLPRGDAEPGATPLLTGVAEAEAPPAPATKVHERRPKDVFKQCTDASANGAGS